MGDLYICLGCVWRMNKGGKESKDLRLCFWGCVLGSGIATA
jgi:hypothetical protein